MGRVCIGLDHSVKLAKKTYHTSINLEQKEQNILKKKIAELEAENSELKERVGRLESDLDKAKSESTAKNVEFEKNKAELIDERTNRNRL